ncbi:MAG: 30S ribosomal protein S27ae [Candidatus Aenigmarchaeota archaeon CG_4_10_14_0_8_um_filter_37_24]|nr:30S ribosomal protein S27ae [Candidatus Aenigmarchaeota archaeon]PIX50395.1 MAG: 30S ribosomal protein S27ae [Candidatus Aenigmarchaeota archaeon CG_4_8_14_3_um_filter_37_24]PIY36450.1 MAG: 30S ribosomal protein S27ae [Candidatus Aenigmarchaeota archaeon CG_4_10_14_3_um_filter_37_21]PIZ35385.1 MAG: 30S ribosomal protein S27ae [Candidatus Aenigmarchaeota archaeon CG_4_10_14_0_8_um_filter_37_24]
MKHKPTKKSEVMKRAKLCPRCGDGVYMAEHKQKDGKTRSCCGKCHYTIWV